MICCGIMDMRLKAKVLIEYKYQTIISHDKVPRIFIGQTVNVSKLTSYPEYTCSPIWIMQSAAVELCSNAFTNPVVNCVVQVRIIFPNIR